ncbi:MAG: (4Fe-4S)-binding protein [Jiangellales bacterium]
MTQRDYVHTDSAGGGIVIHWDSETCVHSGVCLRTLPGVFRARRRPWVDPDGADADAIEAAVAACPSAALTSSRFAGGESVPVRSLDEAEHAAAEPAAPGAAPVSVTVLSHGPYLLKGPVEIVDAHGAVQRRVDKVALCRCGHSGTKPFCDGSHRREGFADEGEVAPSS